MELYEQLKLDTTDLKDYLRIDYHDDDDLLKDMVKTAVELVPQLTSNDFMEFNPETGEMEPRELAEGEKAIIRMFVRRCIASWYEYRDDSATSRTLNGETVALGEAPWGAHGILAPLKRLPGL